MTKHMDTNFSWGTPGTYFGSFSDENYSKMEVKFEYVQNLCDIAAT